MYTKKVNTRSKAVMIEFLVNHFRYATMNHWNNCTSYAHNMKIHNLPVSKEIRDSLYELLDCQGAFLPINDRIADFDAAHKYGWQAGFNGRSGGYLVLYQGSLEDRKVVCYSGKSTDQDEDFSEWSVDDLRDRVKLVQEFDKLADDIVAEVINLATNYVVGEEVYTAQKTRKVLKEKAA
jgi:hypothetical protein